MSTTLIFVALTLASHGCGSRGGVTELPCDSTASVNHEPGLSELSMTSGRSEPSIRAFPGAEGYGATALNGCNRAVPHVFFVTNLSDSGPGSFRQAIADAESAPNGHLKVISFRVGGYITTQSTIRLSGTCMYIAGQTAPGDGIALRGHGLEFQRGARDIVIRFLRIRLGASGVGNGIMVRSGQNLAFDHLSISWSPNGLMRFSRTELPRSGPIQNVTVQRSLLGESLSGTPIAVQVSGTPDTDEQGTVAGWKEVTYFSIHHNALVSNNHRNVNARGLNIEVINNVIYNWNLDAGQTGRGAVVDFVNNYSQKGAMSRRSYLPIGVREAHVATPPFYEPSVYAAGNVALGGHGHPDMNTDPNADNWIQANRLVDWYHSDKGSGSVTRFRRTTRIADPAKFPVTIENPFHALETVLADVGATRALDCRGRWTIRMDAVDARLIQDVRRGEGWAGRPGPNHENEVGGYPPLASKNACQDSNNDGLPDEWKAAQGLDADDSTVAGRIGAGGYSYLEHFLNGTTP